MWVIYLSNNIIMIFIFVLQRGLLDVLRRSTHRSFTSSLQRFSKWMTVRVLSHLPHVGFETPSQMLWKIKAGLTPLLFILQTLRAKCFHNWINSVRKYETDYVWHKHTRWRCTKSRDTCKCRPAPSALCPSQHWKLMSGGTRMKTGTERVISLLICKET